MRFDQEAQLATHHEEGVAVRAADRAVDDPNLAEREAELVGELLDRRAERRISRKRRKLVEEGHDGVGVHDEHEDLKDEAAMGGISLVVGKGREGRART